MQYRREIDGLRAIAVTPVVLFHANIPGFGGGFLGVDVFFVISGYLITSLIAAEMAEGRFSIVNFYERRARRILPALFTVVLATIIAAPIILPPDSLRDFGMSVIAVATFLSNILFWQQSGYFGSVSEETPLLHTWSLAVEEQFYIIFPLFLLLAFPIGRIRLTLTLIGIVLISLGLAEWGWRNAGDADFFLAPTRAFELLLGSLIALQPRERWLSRLPRPAIEIAAFSGLLLLTGSFVVFTEATPHPSFLTLAPVLGTALIIMFADTDTRCGRLLSLPLFVGIGLLSYSIYLWHQPLFAFARVLGGGQLGMIEDILLIAASVGLAWLSWRYIERPFRRKSRFRRSTIFIASLSGTAALIALGAFLANYPLLYTRSFHPDRMERIQQISIATASETLTVQDDCHFQSETFDARFRETFERCAQTYGKALFITGGSHGIDLYNAIALNADYPFIASVSRGYCRAHAFFGERPPYPCHYEDLKAFAAQNANHILRIIYTQTPDRLFPKGMAGATIDDLSASATNEVMTYLSELKRISGVDVAIVGMLPPLQTELQDLDITRPLPEALAMAYSPALFELTRQVETRWAHEAHAAGIGFVSKIDAFDLHFPEDLLIDGAITYSDIRHLSRAGEKAFGARMVRYLADAGFAEFQPDPAEGHAALTPNALPPGAQLSGATPQ